MNARIDLVFEIWRFLCFFPSVSKKLDLNMIIIFGLDFQRKRGDC